MDSFAVDRFSSVNMLTKMLTIVFGFCEENAVLLKTFVGIIFDRRYL